MAPTKTKRKRTSKTAALVVSLAGLALLFLAFLLKREHPSELLQPPNRHSPEFFLQDRTGQMFSSQQLVGSVWVADFIFTHCAGTCPLLGQVLSGIQREWPDRPDLKFVSFTVDPDRDTVPVLYKYAEDFHAPDTQWRFLTGPKADLYRVIQQGFLETAAQAQEPSPGYEFTHSSKVYLMDQEGFIRGAYDMEHPGDDALLKKDIQFLLSRKPAPADQTFNFRPAPPHITFIAKPH